VRDENQKRCGEFELDVIQTDFLYFRIGQFTAKAKYWGNYRLGFFRPVRLFHTSSSQIGPFGLSRSKIRVHKTIAARIPSISQKGHGMLTINSISVSSFGAINQSLSSPYVW
jgi:hypothetical protein